MCHGCGSRTCSFNRLRANFRGVPLDFYSRQLDTFENVDKEDDDYYGSEVGIRFVKQKNGKTLQLCEIRTYTVKKSNSD